MRLLLLVIAATFSFPVLALSKEAKEFMSIIGTLEPVHCEKRKLRRSIALAEAEQREDEARALRKRFATLDKDPKTAKLEKRLAQLEPILERSPDPEDLSEINRQRVEAFYRCL